MIQGWAMPRLDGRDRDAAAARAKTAAGRGQQAIARHARQRRSRLDNGSGRVRVADAGCYLPVPGS
jgi:hypothetical protein